MIECFHITANSRDGSDMSIPVDTILRLEAGVNNGTNILLRDNQGTVYSTDSVSTLTALITTLRTDLLTAITG